MEVHSHTFISFGKFCITHLVFVIVTDVVISDDSVTVSLYPSGCEEDEEHIEGKVYARTAVPIQKNRIRKIFLSATANTAGVTQNTTACTKSNALTIFIPSAFYLISC
jgi:hypothetical protein